MAFFFKRKRIGWICVVSSSTGVVLVVLVLITSIIVLTMKNIIAKSVMKLTNEFELRKLELDEVIKRFLDKREQMLTINSFMDHIDDELPLLMPNISYYMSSEFESTFALKLNKIIRSPASSCAEILKDYPNSPSDYYYIQSTDNSIIRVYCDMTRTCGSATGGWMRIAELDTNGTFNQCSVHLCSTSLFNVNYCRLCGGDCGFQTYPVGVSYSKVCGKVIANPIGEGGGFNDQSNGFDGISIMYKNPPVNIWSFVAGSRGCPCAFSDEFDNVPVPVFVGENYFCDIGNNSKNSMWDGVGCEGMDQCCTFNNPPWFYRELSSPATDDIQMRLCVNGKSDQKNIYIKEIDIYVQ